MSSKTVKQPRKSAAAPGVRVTKVPVVMQMEALECGAASLTMILAYYGKWIPLEQVRADCGVSRDGSNAKNVLKAARSYGLTAKGYRDRVRDFNHRNYITYRDHKSRVFKNFSGQTADGGKSRMVHALYFCVRGNGRGAADCRVDSDRLFAEDKR